MVGNGRDADLEARSLEGDVDDGAVIDRPLIGEDDLGPLLRLLPRFSPVLTHLRPVAAETPGLNVYLRFLPGVISDDKIGDTGRICASNPRARAVAATAVITT